MCKDGSIAIIDILICDGCNDGYHLTCLVPKLERVPLGDWHCPECITEKDRKELEEVILFCGQAFAILVVILISIL